MRTNACKCCLQTNAYRVFSRDWLLKNRPYSEMEHYRNITKTDLCTVFTPVLCSNAEYLSNVLFWFQIYSELLLEIREQKFDLFARHVIFYIWLKFYFLTVRNYDVILKKMSHFITMSFNEQQSKNFIFKKKFHQNIVFFCYFKQKSRINLRSKQ